MVTLKEAVRNAVKFGCQRLAVLQNKLVSFQYLIALLLTFYHRNPKKSVKKPSLRLAHLPNKIGVISLFTISWLVFVSDLSSQEPKECEKTFAEARSAAKQDWFISLVFVSDLS